MQKFGGSRGEHTVFLPHQRRLPLQWRLQGHKAQRRPPVHAIGTEGRTGPGPHQRGSMLMLR